MPSSIWSDATAQAELVRSGEASPGELVDAAIARIEALDSGLNAVIHPRFDAARREAAAVDRSLPFAGVPMVLKDLICELEGEPFHEGMAYLKDLDYRAPADQGLAQRFKQAGFVIVGKSAPASAKNFNSAVGETFAYEDAIRQLWQLEGYALREKLSQRTIGPMLRPRGAGGNPAAEKLHFGGRERLALRRHALIAIVRSHAPQQFTLLRLLRHYRHIARFELR